MATIFIVIKLCVMAWKPKVKRDQYFKLQLIYYTRNWTCSVVILSNQPYLACSDDGFIKTENGFELLEIKCPYSCQNKFIVDLQNKNLAVNDLEFH